MTMVDRRETVPRDSLLGMHNKLDSVGGNMKAMHQETLENVWLLWLCFSMPFVI